MKSSVNDHDQIGKDSLDSVKNDERNGLESLKYKKTDDQDEMNNYKNERDYEEDMDEIELPLNDKKKDRDYVAKFRSNSPEKEARVTRSRKSFEDLNKNGT